MAVRLCSTPCIILIRMNSIDSSIKFICEKMSGPGGGGWQGNHVMKTLLVQTIAGAYPDTIPFGARSDTANVGENDPRE